MGNQPNCRQPLNGWQALGWCFESDNPDTLTAGHSAALSISLCRDSTLGEQVRFPSSRQAVWSISRGGTQLWSSNEQPSSFPAGQAENLAPGACLHWRVDWRVTAHGRPLPPGDYDLTWSTGADIRDANNHEYHDAQVVHVAPASS
jgi:hypothetical protein